MKKLTNKEKEIMDLYWEHGPMFVKELLDYYDEPKPHFNTLSTMVRILEKEGFLDHRQFGNTYQYFPLISETDGRCHPELFQQLLPQRCFLVRQGRENIR